MVIATAGAAGAQQALPAGLVGPDKKIYTKVFVLSAMRRYRHTPFKTSMYYSCHPTATA